MKTNRSILNALRAAAVEIDGQRWVRASVAVKILRLSLSWYQTMAKRHQISELRRLAERGPGGSRRTEVWWSLDGLVRFASCRATSRHRRAWSAKEDQRLIAMAKTMTIEEIGRRLTRTRRAVLARIERIGNLRGVLREHHRLITSGQLLRLVRKRSYTTIRQWRSLGLPCLRRPGRRADALFRLEDVRQFLINHPNLLVTLHPASRKLLRLTHEHLEGRAA